MKRFEHAINALNIRKSQLKGRIFHGNYGSEKLRASLIKRNAEIQAEIEDIDLAISVLQENTHETQTEINET